jgi:4-amino-4-deoxy-L-arabinose transferase-like glycosyltransferase
MRPHALHEERADPGAGIAGVRTTHRWYRRAAVVLLLLHGTLAWVLRGLVPGFWHDEANYLLLARAVGDLGYRDLYALGSPIHAQYPPGLPALFALASIPFGERSDFLIAVVVLCSMGALVLLYDIIRRRSGEGVALAVLGLSAVNPELVEHAGRPLSETPYIFFATLALWAVVRDAPGTNGSRTTAIRWTALAIGAGAYAALTRMVGVTLIGALFLHWVIERRYRRVVALAVTSAVTVGGWLTWAAIAPEKIVGRSYIADATFSERGERNFFATLLDRIVTNVPLHVTESVQWSLPQPSLASLARRIRLPTELTAAAPTVDNVVGIIAVALLGAAGAWVIWRQARPVVLYLILYAALLVVWPWFQTRFVMPLIPIMLWVAIAGAIRLSRLQRWLRPVPVIVVVGIAGMALGRNATVLADAVRCDRAQAATSPTCFPEAGRAFLAAVRFIRDSTPDSAVFLTSTDTQLGYLAARRSLRTDLVESRDRDTLPAYLRARRVEYVLLTPLRPSWGQLVPWLVPNCREFSVVRELPATTLVLRVAQDGAQPSENACDDLQRYVLENPAVRQ